MKPLLPLALTLALVPAPALAAAASPREVLLLYHEPGRVELFGPTEQRAIETVLNHLGLVAHYHNLATGLPDPALSARVRGVVTYIDGDAVKGAAAYADWLAARLAAGQKVALLGGLGFLFDADTGASTDRSHWLPITRALGVEYAGDYLGAPERLRPAAGFPLPAFERPWDTPLPYYNEVVSTAPENEVLIKIQRTDTGKTSDMGVLSPNGALVMGADYVFAVNPFTYHLNWRLDPFRLLGRAMGVAGMPRPDPTTLNGRRAFFAHIDGDGFANVANRPGRPYAAEVVRDEVLARTPLPTTVSVIARELSGKPELEAIARSLFARANVEAGSHSYTHPFNWQRGTTAQEGAISDASAATSYGDVGKKGVQALTPRHEIDDSFRYIQTLLPPGKQVEVMLWSGATNPTEPFVARVGEIGAPNMNGGDAKVDARFPSYADLAPFGRAVGKARQIFTGAANENLFSNLWTGPFDGQRQAVKTFEFQESPRRMAAANIYYHFYAGDRLAGVGALRDLYAWAEQRPLAPVHASAYARMAEGFYTATVAPDGEAAWAIAGLGRLRTVRFDDEAREPDLAASRNVAGFCRTNGALYVHLAAADARVALAASPAPRGHVRYANAELNDLRRGEGLLSATFTGTVGIDVTLAGLPPGSRPRLRGDFRPAGAVETAADGTFVVVAPPGRKRLEVRW